MTSDSKNINNCKSFKKNKNPRCNEQPNCEWIPKTGNKLGYCNQKKHTIKIKKINKEKRETKNKIIFQKKTKNKCIQFKKNKVPKCNEQQDCQWMPKSADINGYCGNKNVNIQKLQKENIQKLSDKKTKNKCIQFKKNKVPKCNEQQDCQWMPKSADINGYCGNKNVVINKNDKGVAINKNGKGLVINRNINKLNTFLEKINSISGICNYGYIRLKNTGQLLLNFGDLHTWSNRDSEEGSDNVWKHLCEQHNNLVKQLITYTHDTDKFINISPDYNSLYLKYAIDRKRYTNTNLNINNIIKNGEIFITHMILYILKNLKNIHFFSETRRYKHQWGNTGRHSTPQWYNKALDQLWYTRPQFMKDNNNYIHYNCFRDNKYIFFYMMTVFHNGKFKLSNKKLLLETVTKIYVLSFLQGYTPSTSAIKDKKNKSWIKKVRYYLDYENKSILDIIKNDLNLPKKFSNELIDHVINNIKEREHDITTIRVDGKIIYCTRMSKQLLKLKPEVQDMVVQWFFTLIINKIESIFYIKTEPKPETMSIDELINKLNSANYSSEQLLISKNDYIKAYKNVIDNYEKYHTSGIDGLIDLKMKYCTKVMFIDFYNLCRILYYSGNNNDNKDMSNNIIINYGGESNDPCFHTFCLTDGQTYGHVSAILYFFRNFYYTENVFNDYTIKQSNSTLNRKKHYSFDTDTIEIKKYLSKYSENRIKGRDCVEIKYRS